MRTSPCMLAIAMLAALAGPAIGGDEEGQRLNLSGVQVYNTEFWQAVQVGDFYGPNYKGKDLKPITMAGTRNGWFSGCVVVANGNAPITGLKGTASDLVCGDKKIPASQIKVRYPEPWQPSKSWTTPYRFDGLLNDPPDEVPIVDPKQLRGLQTKLDQPVAFQPVWVTVKVPADAAPGEYTGKLTVAVDNPMLNPMEVGIKLTVADWQMPDPKDFTVQNLGWLNPEVESRYYNVPCWSDKHIALMSKSQALMLELGSRQVFVNLVTRYPSQDNAETMVTWVKQKDGSLKCDLSTFDKYMDMVAKTIGKPFPIRLNMWCPERKDAPNYPQIRVLDPETGKVEEADQPPVGTTESYNFWKPALDEIRARLDKRGWFDVTGPNWHQYCGGPTPAAVSVLKRIWPDGRWTDMDHGRRWPSFAGLTKEDAMPILTTTTVWNEGSPVMRGYKGHLQPGVAIVGHSRDRHREWFSLWDVRAITEEQIMKGEHGVDPLGGDLWPLHDSRSGRYYVGAWAAAALGPGNCTKAFLAPGPDGAIASERFEAFREGVQVAEAVLFIQSGLDSGKCDAATYAKADKVLDARSRHMLESWPKTDNVGHSRFDRAIFAKDALARENELFATAAEVAKAIGTHKRVYYAKAAPPPPTTAPAAPKAN
ncbi:MAG: DUF6067 family protein [Phycisphaerae bacterium]|nr:DUF6067 family protein [Phycisphaerae bacterium]